MADTNDILERLQFELKFLEDGGYGRSPHAPWRPPYIFEDSPSCLNFNDASRPHPCNECFLEQFVPEEQRKQATPCRFIPLTANGQTVNDFYSYGSQEELEEALKGWLRKEIERLQNEIAASQETNQLNSRKDR